MGGWRPAETGSPDQEQSEAAMAEAVDAPGLELHLLGFLVHAENGGDQHGDGHGNGKHQDHHGLVLLFQQRPDRELVSACTSSLREQGLTMPDWPVHLSFMVAEWFTTSAAFAFRTFAG
jgi:hypothetical protein